MVRTERYAFGDFVLERSQQRVLRLDGTELALAPRLFSALLLFVEHPGELVDKETLIQALWPDVVVEENNLSQVISALRRALGDDAQGSRYIRTAPRRGFRFVAEVRPLPEPADAAAHATSAPAGTALAGADASAEAPHPGIGAAGVGFEPEMTRRRWGGVAAAGLGAALVGGGAWWLAGDRRGRREGAPSTLAVLPFKPLVSQGRDELLEVGMADSLIARLSTLPGLVVRSVGSVRRYAGPEQDPLRAGRELDVTWIVDGSLQRRGDKVRVTARLLSVADGTAAWSGSFDDQSTNVFDVQDAISEKVARVLATSLDAMAPGGAASAMKPGAGTRNTDAYQLYLAARQYAQGVRADGLRKSAGLYNQAIEIDPGYALAYAGLVETYRRMLFGADVAPADAFEPANIAVDRALALAPGLAQAHAGSGWIRFWYDYDWAGAEAVFRKAIMLNPNVAEAHFGLGLLLVSLDRPDEGLAHLRSARELDPMSLILNALESALLFERGRKDEATLRLDRALQLDPGFWVSHLALGTRQAAEHHDDDAVASFRRAESLADGSTQATAALATQLARMDRLPEAMRIRDRLLALARVRYVPPTSLAAVHAALGETVQALDALERAFSVRDTRLVYLKNDVRWASLHGEPRFAALLQRMKLDRFGAGLSPP